MTTTTNTKTEIDDLQSQLHDLRKAYVYADEFEQEKIKQRGGIIKARLKALQIAKDMRENKGKRVNIWK